MGSSVCPCCIAQIVVCTMAFDSRANLATDIMARFGSVLVTATVIDIQEDLTLSLGAAQPAITPGQSAVVFCEEQIIGGGRIV